LPSRSEARRRLDQKFAVGPQDRFVLYPVRCIRRKNLGEALLYGVLSPPGTFVGLTLAPLSPAERSIYAMWRQLAAELELPCRFAVGGQGGLSFAENLAAADLILTTSLAEGFGMVFLESWLAGKPLLGRDLPEITSDFTRLGIHFDWLRPQLRIPLEWIGEESFRQTIIQVYRKVLVAYRRSEPADWTDGLAAKTESGLVDFGDLSEPLQSQVIRTVCHSERNRRQVLQSNPWLEAALSLRAEETSEMIDGNVRAISQHYALLPSGRRLLELYQSVAAGGPKDEIRPLPDRGSILDYFLDPRRFRPILS